MTSPPLPLHPFAGASLSPASAAFAPLAQAIKDQSALPSLFGDSAASDAPAEAPAPAPPANCSAALGLVLASPRDFSLFGQLILVRL